MNWTVEIENTYYLAGLATTPLKAEHTQIIATAVQAQTTVIAKLKLTANNKTEMALQPFLL
jgi:hypothetical protein